MKSAIKFGDDARHSLQTGANLLTKAVASTLGPCGRNVLMDRAQGVTITKDGVSVAKEVHLPDVFENLGVKVLRGAASNTAESVGDGTTTSTVLAREIYNQGIKLVTAGANPTTLKRGIDKALTEVLDILGDMATPVCTAEEVAQIAAIAANGDVPTGLLIAEAMKEAGAEGVINLGTSHTGKSHLEVFKGLCFDRGYISPYFSTDRENMICELRNARVLLCDFKISRFADLKDIMSDAAENKVPLLVIAEDVDGDAITGMVVNTVQGHVQTVAVKAPDFGERMLEQLRDISSVTGGKVLSQDAGEGVKDIGWSILGNVSKVVVTKTSVTLTQDEDVSKSVEGRARSIRVALENATLDLDKEWLQKRLARLLGGVVSIQVGAQTEVELGELRDRVEDALSATRAAVEEGVVPGGGVALLRCMAEMADRENLDEGDESLGYLLIRNALSAPVKQIAANAGEEGAVIIEDLLHCDLDTVYNAQTSELVDAFDEGIIDPVKVTKSAISNAASVAGMLLTTECVIHTDYGEAE